MLHNPYVYGYILKTHQLDSGENREMHQMNPRIKHDSLVGLRLKMIKSFLTLLKFIQLLKRSFVMKFEVSFLSFINFENTPTTRIIFGVQLAQYLESV